VAEVILEVVLPTSLLADIDETNTVTCFCSPLEDMLDVECVMLGQQQQQPVHQQ